MKLRTCFVKLPGEQVNQDHVEQELPNPECYAVAFWIDRDEIEIVVDVKDFHTRELTASTIMCKSGASYYCTLSAAEVVEILNNFDRQRPLFENLN